MRYRSFDDRLELDLVPWLGERVALLTREEDLDAGAMARILAALDAASRFYLEATGREPAPRFTFEGRTTIAEVAGIGGAAWAWLGQTGIEIQPEYFRVLYEGVRDRGEFDQPLFYELGRNFWFYGKTLDLEGGGAVCTGYAVHMRFLAMDAAGVAGGPYRGIPFARFRAAVAETLDRFVAERGDWLAAAGRDHQPAFPVENGVWLSTADLFAALFARIAPRERAGAFFRAAERRPPAKHAGHVLANLFACACDAGGRDLSAEFRAWGWPLAGP